MASIYKRGAYWRAQVRRGEVTLSDTFDTQAEAKAWAWDVERQLERGSFIEPLIAITASRAPRARIEAHGDPRRRRGESAGRPKGGRFGSAVPTRKSVIVSKPTEFAYWMPLLQVAVQCMSRQTK